MKSERDDINPAANPSGTGCVACLALGGWWLHLRRCAHAVRPTGPVGSHFGLIHSAASAMLARLGILVWVTLRCHPRRTRGKLYTWLMMMRRCAARWRACSTRWGLTPKPTQRPAIFWPRAMQIDQDASLSTSAC